MKIIITIAALDHGGASIIAMDVARGMAQRGHQVMLLTTGYSTDCYNVDGYQVQVLGQNKHFLFYHYLNPLIMWKFYKVLENFQPDIINFHNINLRSFSLASLLFSLRFPVIWTLHDLWALCLIGWPLPPDCKGIKKNCRPCPTWPYSIVFINKFIKEYIYSISRMSILCPSNWLASQLKYSSLNDRPIHVINNGIDLNLFPPLKNASEKSRLNIPDWKTTLLFCGGKRLAGRVPAERKGWYYLLDALKILGKRRKDLHLIYIGDRLDLPFLLPFSITFERVVDRSNMKMYYGAADIFILPTLGDNHPLTILEAMASKIPVIATNTGGIPEIIVHNETALLCEPRDSKGLAANIEYLILNQDKGIEMAERAYKELLNRFNQERMINEYENVYKETIASNMNKLHPTRKRFACDPPANH